MFYEFALYWILIGLACSLLAIYYFRRDGRGQRGELYLASIGPLFGPIVGILLIMDILFSRKNIIPMDSNKSEH